MILIGQFHYYMKSFLTLKFWTNAPCTWKVSFIHTLHQEIERVTGHTRQSFGWLQRPIRWQTTSLSIQPWSVTVNLQSFVRLFVPLDSPHSKGRLRFANCDYCGTFLHIRMIEVMISISITTLWLLMWWLSFPSTNNLNHSENVLFPNLKDIQEWG
jgi:hypothetical protein